MLLLMAATGAMAQSTPITTVRSWDFTKGGRNSDWESAQEAATSVWGGKDSSFRYSNANNLSGEELTDGTNPLKGLAGIYFTAPAGSLLLGGVNSSTRCLQTNGDGVSILLPDCAAKDRITIRFCASVNNTTVTITSDQMKSSYVANSTDRSNEVSAFVKENGNVVLNVPSKVRIYEIKVEPYVAVTNFNLSAETVTVTENKTVTVTATGFSPSNAFDKTLEWTTADENVATVANGVITGVNPGTTTITVTSVDGPSKTIGVTVLPTYSVTLVEGTEDADKWTVKVGEGEAQAFPVEGLDGGETVTATYSGEKKVKSVKAVKKAPKPDLLSSVFSISSTKKVKFSKGNLSYASSKWSFFDNQYDYYTSYSADAWDKFGWSTSATTYGMNTSTNDNNYSGDFVDWGATMGTGWFTLTKDEWTYLLNTRSASTVGGTANGRYAKAEVNDVMGVILFPDTYTHPEGVTVPTGVNATDNTGWNGNSYTAADWTKMESAGCVFLPAAGGRDGSTVNLPGWYGYYWSATPSGAGYAYYVSLTSSSLQLYSYDRYNGYSVRLVREVTE